MRRGPLYMICAGLMFSMMITLVKTARAELGAVEIAFWRAFISLPFTYVFAHRVGLRIHNVRVLVVRCVFGFTAVLFFFLAAKGLWIADISLLSQLQPLLVAILAPLALGAVERPGPLIWALMAVGFVGCALILAPDLAVGSVYGVYALIGAASSAAAHVCLRALMRTDDSRVVVFYFHAVLAVAFFGVMAVDSGGLPALPSGDLLPILVGVGLTATAGQLLMTQAYAEDRAPVVAAARYSTPLWGVLIDLVIFGVLPDWNVWAGGALLISAGLALIFLPDRAERSG